MFVRTLAILLLSTATLIAAGPGRRYTRPDEVILGHWKVMYGEAEYFLRKDGQLIIKDEAGLITNQPWKVANVDKTDDAVTIIIDPGPSQWELTLRYESKGFFMLAEHYDQTPQGIRRSAAMWEWLGSKTEPDEKQADAKVAVPDWKPPPARDLPPEQAVLGTWDTPSGTAGHFFGPDGRYCLSGCGVDDRKKWSIVERTEKEIEQGVMRIRTDVEYRLHFASDGRSILCEWFDNYQYQKPPRRVAQTWILVKEPAQPAEAEKPKPEKQTPLP